MAATVTVTGVIGPGNSLTSKQFTDVTSVRFDTVNNLIGIVQADKITDIDITSATTITATKSGSTYTFTVSQ